MAARMSTKGLAAAGRSYWREADAWQVVRAWERGGQTLSPFAATRGLKGTRLARWAKRLRGRAVRRGGHEGAGAAPLQGRPASPSLTLALEVSSGRVKSKLTPSTSPPPVMAIGAPFEGSQVTPQGSPP